MISSYWPLCVFVIEWKLFCLRESEGNIEFSKYKKNVFFFKFRNATWLSGEKAFLFLEWKKRSYKSGITNC